MQEQRLLPVIVGNRSVVFYAREHSLNEIISRSSSQSLLRLLLWLWAIDMINLGGWELLTPIHQTSQKGSLADTKIQWGDTSSFAIFVVSNSHPGGIISSLLHILMHRNNWNFQRKHTHYLHNVISFFIGTYIGAVGNQSFSQSVKVAIFLQTLHSAHLFLRCSLYSSMFLSLGSL